MSHLSLDSLYLSATLLPALVAGGWDIATRRIPNWLTGITFLAGLILHLSLGGFRSAGSAFLAGLIAGIIFLIFHLAGGMGAGDVKLIAAICCVAGLPNVVNILVLTALSGGAMALLLAYKHGQLGQTMRNVGTLAVHHGKAGMTPHPELNVQNRATIRLPYAVAIACGCILTLLGKGGLV